MAATAVGGDFMDQPPTGCWCCGDATVGGSLVRLGNHPEVGVCFRCVKVLAIRKREIQRQTRKAPMRWPLRRRVTYRLGFNRC